VARRLASGGESGQNRRRKTAQERARRQQAGRRDLSAIADHPAGLGAAKRAEIAGKDTPAPPIGETNPTRKQGMIGCSPSTLRMSGDSYLGRAIGEHQPRCLAISGARRSNKLVIGVGVAPKIPAARLKKRQSRRRCRSSAWRCAP
jgi:hypothetical protein